MVHAACLIALSVLLQDGSGQNTLAKPIDTYDLIFRVLGVAGSILLALGGVIGYLLNRYWAARDRDIGRRERKLAGKDAERAKLRDVLYESLKWFEGGTQNRSIGIAVVRTSWELHPEFHKLWIEVLANQVIYLLAAQEPKDRPHENENLRRIMETLLRESALIDTETYRILCDTIRRKSNGEITEGLPLTPNLKNRLDQWATDLKCSYCGVAAEQANAPDRRHE